MPVATVEEIARRMGMSAERSRELLELAARVAAKLDKRERRPYGISRVACRDTICQPCAPFTHTCNTFI